MSRSLRFAIFFATTCFTVSAAYADMFNFGSSSNTATSTTKAPKQGLGIPPQQHVMTPDEFKSGVNAASQRMQQETVQQGQNSLNQMGGPPLPQGIQAPHPAPSQNQNSDNQSGSDQSNNQQTQQQSPAQAAPQQQAAQSAPPPSAAQEQPQQQAPQQPQSQPYTGFQNSTSGTSGNKSTSSSGGGWNVKY